MASSGVNVARWSFLALGVLYGLSHQRALTAQQRAEHAARRYTEEESLIARAKAEYLKKTRPAVVGSGGGVITDPNDPKFDLEAYLTMSEAEDRAKH